MLTQSKKQLTYYLKNISDLTGIEAFTALGCKKIVVLDIRSKEDSEKEASIKLIKNADCVMFSGGDQSKITKKIGGTTIHRILAHRYKNEQGVFAQWRRSNGNGK